VNLWDDLQTISDITSLRSVSFAEREGLPSSPGLYFAVSHTGDVLYIGKAVQLRSRWRYHHRLGPLLVLSCSRIHWLSCPHDQLVQAEEALNERFNPPLRRRRTTPPRPPQRASADPDRLCRELAAVAQKFYGISYEAALAELRALK
jgi:hypothetical protein